MSKSKSRDQVKKQESFKKTDVNGDITKIIFPHDIQVGLKNDDFAATISGSIHHTRQGLPYLVGGDNVNIVSASNGQVTISSTASGGGGSSDPTSTFTTYAFYQSASPTGDPTNEFHFEWDSGQVDNSDPENTNQNRFWQWFPKGGKIVDVVTRGGGTTNFSADFPTSYDQRMVVALYQFNDTWINSSENTAHAGYTPIGHVTSSLPAHEVANEGGTYHHRAMFELSKEYINQNLEGTFVIPSGSSVTLTYKGIGSAGALQKCAFFVTVEKNL